MSLFVGNVSKYARESDLTKEFDHFGKCRVDIKGKYAFIDYDQESDAERAMEKLRDHDFSGLKINIEWSKKSNKHDRPRGDRNDRDRPRRDLDDVKCYNCNRRGHFARDCKERKRSRSPRRDRRDDSRDRHRRGRERDYKRRSRSRSRSRDHDRRRRSRSYSRDSRDRRPRRDRDDRRRPRKDSRDYSPKREERVLKS